jgi:hypothetical protein
LQVSSTNKTDRQDISEILLKVAFKHHKPKPYSTKFGSLVYHHERTYNCHEFGVKQQFNNISAISWWSVLLMDIVVKKPPNCHCH